MPASGEGGGVPGLDDGATGTQPDASAARAASQITDLKRTDIPPIPLRPTDRNELQLDSMPDQEFVKAGGTVEV